MRGFKGNLLSKSSLLLFIALHNKKRSVLYDAYLQHHPNGVYIISLFRKIGYFYFFPRKKQKENIPFSKGREHSYPE